MTEPTPTVETPMQVMFYDTDCGAVVHNTAYLRFIEMARTELAEKLGLSLREMSLNGRFPVVVRTEIDYRRPGVLGDRVVVRGWLESLERSRFWCAFRVERASDGTVLATSRQMLALVQMPEGKAIRLPQEWAGKYPHLVGRGEAEARGAGH
ncbi:MAG TPA: thioesterase family protein [Chthoniobacteraceae bacterium]|nr:thioesterase family protein [Chthoniobacteraceae bacterium]